MIVENNFLTKHELRIIDNEIVSTGNMFPWYWHEWSTSKDFPYYGHILMRRDKEGSNSSYYDFFTAIVDRFIKKHNLFKDDYEVLRSAVNDNLTFVDKACDPHVDYEREHLVFIMYLTDSSGDTNIYTKQWKEGDLPELYDKHQCNKLKIQHTITPKQGKIICYNGLNYHSADSKQSHERRIICVYAITGEQNGMVI